MLFGSYSIFCSFLFTFYSLFSSLPPLYSLGCLCFFSFSLFSFLTIEPLFSLSTINLKPLAISLHHLCFFLFFYLFFILFFIFLIYFFSLFLFFFTFTSQPKRLQLAFQSFMLQASAYKPQHFSFKTQIIHYI